ncbi:MAG: hypothetical protein BGN96_00205 [Bacteroidales bacterium 45-6]|nr:MAG: hypothetical protein BGN96_00205 [Bacteroidales bacterium 45-6]
MTAISKNAEKPAVAQAQEQNTTMTVVKPANQTAEAKQPTIEEIKQRATIINLLQGKHTQLTEKLNSLEKFDIEHDRENVTAQLEDASGRSFTSSSPKTIKLVLDSWKSDFKEAIAETEQKLKEAFNW